MHRPGESLGTWRDAMNIEKLAYSAYDVRMMRRSAFDVCAETSRSIGFRCPKCRHLRPSMEHFGRSTCDECGLNCTLHGNCLRCSMEHIPEGCNDAPQVVHASLPEFGIVAVLDRLRMTDGELIDASVVGVALQHVAR